MRRNVIRAEIQRALTDTALDKLQKLADDAGLQALIRCYARETHDVESLEDLSEEQLLETIHFVERFAFIIRGGSE